MLGVKHVVKVHEWVDPNDAAIGGVLVFDSFVRQVFSHNASFVADTTTVTKNDFSGSDNDAFTVIWAYVEGNEPDLSATNIEGLRVAAATAINTAFGGGTVDRAETNPSAY